jgi:3-deoxy-7-phosphoheptulonate synthase
VLYSPAMPTASDEGLADRCETPDWTTKITMTARKLEGTDAMVVVMEERATEAQIEQVVSRLVEMGMDVHRSTGVTRTVLGVVGQKRPDAALIEMLDGVHEVLRISEPYKLASRTFKPENTVVTVGDVRIGGDEVIVMAGPCSAESEKQVQTTAVAVRRAGAKIFRGGAFKPRSSPYSFQGMGEEGLKLLRDACNRESLYLVSEVMDASQIEVMHKYVDIYQVGARNMQNFTLLRELGHVRKPVLLKRGISATIEEWLLSAEYVLSGGNTDVILCERGIRTFETATRNTLDIAAIPIVQKMSHLPVVIDPSHAVGRRDKVAPVARAAVAAGADGLLIEVHCDPDHALSDGAQSMFPSQFDRLMAELRIIAPAIGRSICLETVARRGWGA